jgi:Transposase DDE domain group 1
VSDRSGFYPRVRVDGKGRGVVSQAGGVLLARTVRAAGLDLALSDALSDWRRPMAIHDPAKVLLDLAIAVALGGDCLADIAVVRAEPAVFGLVASDATVSRTIDTLATDAPAALRAISTARATARTRAWRLAGKAAPSAGIDAKTPLVIDLDATLVTAHSDKEQAAPTFKRGFGHHPLWAFADHGPDGTGEPLAVELRAGNAGSNTAADHITVIREALRQLPADVISPTARGGGRVGRKVLVRIDGAGATHDVVNYLVARRMSYSVGFTLPDTTPDLIKVIPESAWTPAYDAGGKVRPGAWVAELTGLLDLAKHKWPKGMRVIVRKERPHPGAQLRLTDVDGNRLTAFATNTAPGGVGTQLPDLELRHRRRARCEDRIRCAKDSGLTNLPLHDFAQNQIWCAVICLACEITAWMQMLALTAHPARRWEPKRLRLRLFSIAAQLTTTARVKTLHLSGHAAWTQLALDALERLTTLTAAPAPSG